MIRKQEGRRSRVERRNGLKKRGTGRRRDEKGRGKSEIRVKRMGKRGKRR